MPPDLSPIAGAGFERRLPGSRWAARIRPFDSPVLRVRYRRGVVINLAGLPEWDLLARAVVELPEPEPDLCLDEMRVLDVVTANAVMLAAGDPLWAVSAADYAPLTPPGWVWAHQFGTRRIRLLPAEAHGAFRHLGGVSTLAADRTRRGVAIERALRVPWQLPAPAADATLDAVEQRIGQALPPAYRGLLGVNSGAAPTVPGVLSGHGFVVDQPLFGLATPDRHQDLLYARHWFADRFTAEFLPIGYVQGGVLALRIASPDAGSVWFADADDSRDDDRHTAGTYCAELLTRCADDFNSFLAGLAPVPDWLLDLADARISTGSVARLEVPEQGRSLPPSRR